MASASPDPSPDPSPRRRGRSAGPPVALPAPKPLTPAELAQKGIDDIIKYVAEDPVSIEYEDIVRQKGDRPGHQRAAAPGALRGPLQRRGRHPGGDRPGRAPRWLDLRRVRSLRPGPRPRCRRVDTPGAGQCRAEQVTPRRRPPGSLCCSRGTPGEHVATQIPV